ncbi:MAG: ABC transporter permease [Cellulosilyticaceae bacterium]
MLSHNQVQGQKELDEVMKQLEDSEAQLLAGEQEVQVNQQKLVEGKAEIDAQQKQAFDQLDQSSYYIFDRTDNQGYLGYKDAIVSLDNIASVLPLFFFLVAIMICLTTMTRMVEENRIEIGTLKALGYTNLEISWKYIVYATLASVVGSVLGIVIGCNVLPRVISSAYGSLYSQPTLAIYYYPSFIVQSMLLSILCTVGAALFVVRVELKSKPSQLMQPKVPKIGKKILLERITLLWCRLSFNHKVTLRNIFRYKQRMMMTILGISGCMALLVTGFGLKDSTSKIVDQQFDKLWRYEAMVILDENATKEDLEDYQETVMKMPGYESGMKMHQESVTFEKEKMNKQTATLYVPTPGEQLSQFVYLNNRLSGEQYEVPDEGVIIDEKLAKLLAVSVGDEITLTDEHHKSYTVRVAHIAENYVMHFVYMSPTYYEQVLKDQPSTNTELLNFNESAEEDDILSANLLASKSVINVTMKAQMEKSTEETNDSMKLVMIVIIVSAGALAFVVLYNLNNINVSERIRELSTIKVLGFYHNEVTMYILRENVILTLLGILVGSIFGKVLHGFILQTAETDMIMMYPEISMMSYVFSALLTLFFSVVVMILMHIKIKNVNMIDALKSNE